MPATYAALEKALHFVKEVASFSIKSMLDLGAGPGTAMWAACEAFSEIDSVTLIEKDLSLAALGKQLALFGEFPSMHRAIWQEGDLEKISTFPQHDLVVLSYSVGELAPQSLERLIAVCWEAAQELLLIMEPGTPAGFERIRMIREQLIICGAHIIAPCPHHLACPMSQGDWCHFSARLERSILHRRIKGGSLGYEDEKFSYVAVTKKPHSLPHGRILRQPVLHRGHLTLKQCTPEGVQQSTFSKKMGSVYQQMRKAEWGDMI